MIHSFLVPRLYSRRKPSFHALSACIRLGHKYQIDHVVDEALTFLRQAYPKDFPSYLSRSMFREEHAVGAVNLARLVGAADILPVVLLDCCALFGVDLVQGFVRPDGTHEALTTPELAICAEGKGRLVRENVYQLRRVTKFKPSPKCEGGTCVAVEAFAKPLDEHDWQAGLGARILAPWGPSVSDGEICAPCLKAWEDQVMTYRQGVWNRLPDILGIDTPDGWVKG